MKSTKKKKVGFIGSIAASGLAGLVALSSFGPQATTLSNVQQKIAISQQQQKQTPMQSQTSVRANDQLPDEMGGIKLGGKHFGFGISPKEYGMYHVRRGTHKRTNRK